VCQQSTKSSALSKCDKNKRKRLVNNAGCVDIDRVWGVLGLGGLVFTPSVHSQQIERVQAEAVVPT